MVKLSLDAVSYNVFKKIDRPLKEIDIEKIIDAIIEFSKQYKGELYIEILFVKGINDKDEEIKKLNETLLKIRNITRIDLSTIDRPPAYRVLPLSFEELHAISLKFDNKLPIHIASRHKSDKKLSRRYQTQEILDTLKKRPLTDDDIEILFDEKSKSDLKKLLKQKKIHIKKAGNLEFYAL
jgi:wyosine [tRNA(Phe)-imidazoG37] synthetase (radical SAM superfamily)